MIITVLLTCAAAVVSCGGETAQTTTKRNEDMTQKPVAGTDGNKCVIDLNNGGKQITAAGDLKLFVQ